MLDGARLTEKSLAPSESKRRKAAHGPGPSPPARDDDADCTPRRAQTWLYRDVALHRELLSARAGPVPLAAGGKEEKGRRTSTGSSSDTARAALAPARSSQSTS